MMAWLLVMLAFAFGFQPEAKLHQEEQLGCLAGQQGWSYCFTLEDYYWFANAVDCETSDRSPEDERAAIGWTLVHRFYQTRGMFPSFSRYLQGYCQCINPNWGSGGSRRTSRNIVERVDRNRVRSLWEINRLARQTAMALMRGEVPDRWPTYVHFLASGYEDSVSDGRIGPYYVTGPEYPRNAFYADYRSVRWLPAPVNVVSRDGYVACGGVDGSQE